MKLKVLKLIFISGAALSVAQLALSADNDVAEGHKYFVRYCASCHGTDALGDGPGQLEFEIGRCNVTSTYMI
jgi:mono/diheme cytochrome c family protein